ncbi:hypothetical protein NECID01_1530 [Nematocida sp. AWRm77]|nr:hypothetical protein NECID01_1530 [Nematocida sp. AWRm77]
MKGRAFGGGEEITKENENHYGRRNEPEAESTDEDYSSSGEYQVAQTPVKMELSSADVYVVHEEIQLEWPSLTVCAQPSENRILLGSFPPRATKPHITEIRAMPSFDNIKDIRKTNSVVTHGEPNRIRASKHCVYAVSNTSFSVLAQSLEEIQICPIDGGYALSTHEDRVFYGNGSEVVVQNEESLDSLQRLAVPEKEIFSIAPLSSASAMIATQNLTLADFRSSDMRKVYTSKCDINSVAYNGDSLVLFGNDQGVLTLFDTRAMRVLETVRFHKSPITNVAFSSRDAFASSSDCEVVLWDMSFTEEWEHHKYLSFVHQGQTYYKDFQFITPETVITTSADGLCVFSPRTTPEETEYEYE